MVKELILSQGKVTIVDDEDYEYLNQWKWNAHFQNGKNWYATRNSEPINGKRKEIRIHRVITNAQSGSYVDHINGDGLDNRRCNLRICTNAENGMNQELSKNNKSGYKGVIYHKRDKKYSCSIGVNGKRIHLGYFNNKIEAALAYDEAAVKYHGKFAKLNFPYYR